MRGRSAIIVIIPCPPVPSPQLVPRLYEYQRPMSQSLSRPSGRPSRISSLSFWPMTRLFRRSFWWSIRLMSSTLRPSPSIKNGTKTRSASGQASVTRSVLAAQPQLDRLIGWVLEGLFGGGMSCGVAWCCHCCLGLIWLVKGRVVGGETLVIGGNCTNNTMYLFLHRK